MRIEHRIVPRSKVVKVFGETWVAEHDRAHAHGIARPLIKTRFRLSPVGHRIIGAVVILAVLAWAMIATRPVTMPVHVPVVIRHGDTAWDLCAALGHVGDLRSCASGHGTLIPGSRVVFTVRKEAK
jgi:hypothetical protein